MSKYFWQYSVCLVGRHSGCQTPDDDDDDDRYFIDPGGNSRNPVMLKGFLHFPNHFLFWSNPSM